MNIKYCKDQELHESLKSLILTEREVLTKVLEHIAEVNRRKLYLKMSFTNLFEYLTRGFGYSAGSAQRRIDAARLMKDVPELPAKLESGSLNLAQISLVQKSIRAKKAVVSQDEKQQLIQDISGLSFEESQKTVAQRLDIEIKASPKITHQQNESVRFEVTLSKEQWEKLQQMRELLSTSLPHGSWDEVLEYVSNQVIQHKTKISKTPTAKTITPAVRKFVIQRDKCCRFQNCGSKWNLQIDHIIPIWAGGTNELSNLQALCANHNRQRYKEQAGVRTVH